MPMSGPASLDGAAVFVIGRARPLGADHAGADRLLRHAGLAEERAVGREDLPLEHVAAAAWRGFPARRPRGSRASSPRRTRRTGREIRSPEPGMTPMPRHPVSHGAKTSRISSCAFRFPAGVTPREYSFSTRATPSFFCRSSMETARRMSSGSKPAITHGNAVPLRDRQVGVRPDDDGDVRRGTGTPRSGCRDPPPGAPSLRGSSAPTKGRRNSSRRAPRRSGWRRRWPGAVVSKPTPRKTISRSGVGGGQRDRVEGGIDDADVEPLPPLLLQRWSFSRGPGACRRRTSG